MARSWGLYYNSNVTNPLHLLITVTFIHSFAVVEEGRGKKRKSDREETRKRQTNKQKSGLEGEEKDRNGRGWKGDNKVKETYRDKYQRKTYWQRQTDRQTRRGLARLGGVGGGAREEGSGGMNVLLREPETRRPVPLATINLITPETLQDRGHFCRSPPPSKPF